MRFLIFAVLSLIMVGALSAQTEKQNIYSGGMLILQPGYTSATNAFQKIETSSLGVGGILRFYLFNYLATGIYGGTQKSHYKTSTSSDSYINLGYGGVFLGFTHKVKKFRFVASGFVGGGSVKNLHINQQNQTHISDAQFYKKSGLVLSPILSIDYSLTQRLNLTVQTVVLYSKYDETNYIFDPIFQVGLLFSR